MTVQATDLPNYERPEVKATRVDLNLVHDLLGGTRRMWDQSHVYIKKWRDEDQAIYDIRRKMETVFEGLKRTLSAATGMLFAIPPAITYPVDDSIIEDQLDNVDASGTALPVFAKRFANTALSDGLGAILVDHTPEPLDVTVTAANEDALGLRPTWASYRRDQVINWRTTVINGARTLSMAVLREEAEEDDGLYGIKSVTRFRVLRLINGQASWSVYRQVKEVASTVDAFRLEGAGYFRNRVGEISAVIPLAIAYTGDTHCTMTATIPLIGVAWANLAHWQIATDMRFYRALCAFPQPSVSGSMMQEPGLNDAGAMAMVPGRVRVGPMVVIHLEAGGEFKWIELTGTSIEQLEKGADEKLHAMSMLGMSFLLKDLRNVETAEAKRLDATAENSTLATAAQGIEDALNTALQLHAWYLGMPKEDAPTLRISRDYENTTLDAQTMLVYVTAVATAGLPVRMLLEAWKIGGRLAPDTDLDDLEMQMMSNMAAKQNEAADAAAAGAAGASKGKKDSAAPAKKGMSIEYGANGRPSRVVPE